MIMLRLASSQTKQIKRAEVFSRFRGEEAIIITGVHEIMQGESLEFSAAVNGNNCEEVACLAYLLLSQFYSSCFDWKTLGSPSCLAAIKQQEDRVSKLAGEHLTANELDISLWS